MPRKVILLLCLLLTLGFRVRAAGRVDVVVRAGENPVPDCQVALYRAGSAVEEGYLLEQGFGGGVILAEDMFSADLANWMADRAAEGTEAFTDPTGRASFGELAQGLYLVTQPSENRFRPYLVCISEEIPYIDTYPEAKQRELPRTGMDSAVRGAFPALPLSLGGLLVMGVRELQKRRKVRSVRWEE